MRPKDMMMMEAMAGKPPQKSPMNVPPAAQPTPVRGKGGGLADLVPASVQGEPAALSEGEFVVPADVVAMLGDGSSEAGARVLQGLVDKIRSVKSKSGKKQAKPLKDLLKNVKK
jgi:hypothetical protein